MDHSDLAVDISDLTRTLQRLSETPAKQRSTKASVTVDRICDYAYRTGLDSASLRAIVNIVSIKSELDQTSVTNLVKNLYPTGKISSGVITKVISGLGQGGTKPSTATQSALLKWLFTVYNVLESPTILSRLYSLLFNLLDMVSLRSPLCHLLSIVTRRRHVRPFRIQYLYELCRIVGNEPALIGLLRVYKDYYPDIIISSPNPGRGSIPPQPDAEWVKRLQAIVHQSPHILDGQQGRNGFQVSRTLTRTSRSRMLPEVHTSLASESSVTLEEIEGPQDFVDKLERLELPNQLVSSLQDSLLQKFLLLNPQPIAFTRLDFWLTSYLEEELYLAKNHLQPSQHFADLLRGILAYTRTQQSLIPVVETFLVQYLPVWDGASNFDSICAVIALMDRHSFTSLHSIYLRWLERPQILTDDQSLSKLLLLYGKLIQRWILQEDTGKESRAGRTKLPRKVNDLLDHVNLFILNLLSMRLSTAMIHSAILTFYEVISSSPTHSDDNSNVHAPIVFPPEQVVYHLLFCCSLSDFSRLCGVLARCKRQFESLKNAISDYYPSPYTNRFNGHLMDICNLLWRSRALNSTDTNASGCLCPRPTMEALLKYLPDIENIYNLAGSYGISQNYLLCAISMVTLGELEDAAENSGVKLKIRQAGPASQRSLSLLEKGGGLVISWTKFRVDVLSTLEAKGLGGVKDLMFSTMMKLKDATA